jgi:hypothetical protein
MDDIKDFMFEAARLFDEHKLSMEKAVKAAESRQGGDVKGDRPGDDYNRQVNWADVLTPAGWRLVGSDGTRDYWKRPGKDEPGISATTGYCHSEMRGSLLYVFSTNAHPLEAQQAYSKFEACAFLQHGGDFKAAAEELVRSGFGGKQGVKINSVPVLSLGKEQERNNNDAKDTPKESRRDRVNDCDKEPQDRWPVILDKDLKRREGNDKWIWTGYISKGDVTLFSAIPKCGKSTLLCHLLKALREDGVFLGQEVKKSKVLYVTEETENLWTDRKDKVHFGDDYIGFIIRPFRGRANHADWLSFIGYVVATVKDGGYDLVVFDTISKMWSCRDENDASAVDNALMPVWDICDHAALALIHHLRKSDGLESTGARGSGALTAFVDTIMELRRFDRASDEDPKRVLRASGRYEETPMERVIELHGSDYALVGTKEEVVGTNIEQEVLTFLRSDEYKDEGLSIKELEKKITGSSKRIGSAISKLFKENKLCKSGKGKKGSPAKYMIVNLADTSPTREEVMRQEVCAALAYSPDGNIEEVLPKPAEDIAKLSNMSVEEAETLLSEMISEGLVEGKEGFYSLKRFGL